MGSLDQKRIFLLLILIGFMISLSAQVGYHRGDQDGMVPYEMEGRVEPMTPIITFEECGKWRIEAQDAEARLESGTERPLFDRGSTGRLVYRKTGENPQIILRPLEKIPVDPAADTVAVWNHGSHGGFAVKETMTILVEDANGVEREIDNFPSNVSYVYWFYLRRRIPADIARPFSFTGIKLTRFAHTELANSYYDSVYFYSASHKELTFEPFPEHRPFPTREDTILPDQFLPCVGTAAQECEDIFTFQAKEPGFAVMAQVDLSKPFLDGVQVNGLYPFSGAKVLLDNGAEISPVASQAKLEDDALVIEFPMPEADDLLSCRIRLKNKSLIFDFKATANPGRIAKLDLGEATGQEITNSFVLPYLTLAGIGVYSDNSTVDPRVIATNDYFMFSQFDWYNSDASRLYCTTYSKEHPGRFNGGVEYLPKTDGNRNALRERLFLNISPNLWKVFPTIDNPPSPMREAQCDRIWFASVERFEPKVLLPKNMRLRKLGMDKVTVRYHECLWRDEGDSFTFRLDIAPRFHGDDSIVANFVSGVQALGWKIGLYTNYTDLAAVNANWDEDHAQQNSDGDFKWSWFRCYAPKPMWAWQMERRLAPQIHARFGEDHSYCDVHTCVTPFERTDFDYRVPGAGMFRRTFECYGLILLNEKVAHRGPVYSEGISHWFYAGLSDGNYGQFYLPPGHPWFPDFNLRKLHVLEMDAGAEEIGTMYTAIPREVASTLAYGNMGIVGADFTDEQFMERYYLIQPLQRHYVMVPVKFIGYADETGTVHASSEALRRPGIIENGRIKVVYENGFTVMVNQKAVPWNDLPEFGWEASSADGSVISVRKLSDGKVFEACSGPVSHYIKGDDASFHGMKVVNGAVALKLEAEGWELIPARNYEQFAFEPGLVGVTDGGELLAIAVDEAGNELSRQALKRTAAGKFLAPTLENGVFKYLLR